jgi:hypothetical protein
MKPLVAALIGVLFGLLMGYELAGRVFFPKLARDARLAAHSIESEQRSATLVSLAALTKLEAGEVDKTKSFLAHQIAGYSRASFDGSLPEHERLRSFIDAASAKSPALKEELAKPQE